MGRNVAEFVNQRKAVGLPVGRTDDNKGKTEYDEKGHNSYCKSRDQFTSFATPSIIDVEEFASLCKASSAESDRLFESIMGGVVEFPKSL